MSETNDADLILEAFDKKALARRNLRCLDPTPDESTSLNKIRDKKGPSEEDGTDKSPFKPSSFG